MIPAHTVDAWAALFVTAAARFDALADEATAGSPRYLELLTLARRCEAAADYAGDEAAELLDAEDAAGAKAAQAGADVARAAP